MIFAQARNLSFVYDGFPKLNKYEVGEDGEVYISEKFLNTSYYRFSQEKRDIPKVPLMGATTPSFPPFAMQLPQFTPAELADALQPREGEPLQKLAELQLVLLQADDHPS